MKDARRKLLQKHHDWGFSQIPQIYPKDEKVPLTLLKTGAKDWTVEPQTLDDLLTLPDKYGKPAWDRAEGAAAVLGAVSGGLTVFDLDKQPTEKALAELCEALDTKPFYQWSIKTPGGGYQVWVRCPGLVEYLTSQNVGLKGGKLDWQGKHGGHIELRVEGILATLPHSRRPSGIYEPLNGDINEPPAEVSPARVWAAFQKIANKPPEAEKPAHKPYMPSELPSNASELKEVEQRVRAEIANRLRKKGDQEGHYYCYKDHRSPKLFYFNPEVDTEIGGCQGRHNSETHYWMDIAKDLEIDTTKIARDVWEEHNLSTLGHKSIYPNKATASENGDCSNRHLHNPHRLAAGWSVTLNDRLVGAHLKFKPLRIKSQHPAAQVMLAWHEMREIIEDDALFTAGEFQRATEQIDRHYTRRTVDTGLEQAVAWGFARCTFCNTESSTTITDRLSIAGSKCTTPANSGEKLYQFLPIDEQLANFERHWRYLLREVAYAEIPDNVQPEWGVPANDIPLVDEIRAGIYETYAGLRNLAEKRLITRNDSEAAHQLDKYLDGDLARVRAGRYQSVAVQSGPMPNTKAFRQALIMQPYHDNPTYVRENANRTAIRKAGVTRATASRYREQLGLILEDRSKEVPSDQVSDSMRRRGLVLAEDPTKGTSIIRLPSAERLLITAPAEVQQAWEGRKQAKASRQERRRELEEQWAQRLAEWQQEGADINVSAPEYDAEELAPMVTISSIDAYAETIPAAYSDGYLLRQFEYTPGSEDMPRYRVDPETGEIIDYTPSELWQMLAAQIRADRKEMLSADPLIASALALGGQLGNILTHA
jgi:hypothetical protein